MIYGIDNIPDWEMRLKRQDAFFNKDIIDRPCVLIPVQKEYESKYKSEYNSLKDRWFDSEFQADIALENIENTEFYGDALPSVIPNLGPEVFSAFCGLDLEFGETTSWSNPFIDNWEFDISKINFSKNNDYFLKIDEMTDILIEKGKGKFWTGITDIHPGGDGVAAFRDPEKLNMDLIDCPEYVSQALELIRPIYCEVFDYFYDKLKSKSQPCLTWLNVISSKRFYIPSNDFSCMISDRMFKNYFLDELIFEMKFNQNNIYHLDGPAALSHLDTLLTIKELNAIQWVPGVGLDTYSNDYNLPILKKIQNNGKGIVFYIKPTELDTIMDNLSPFGVHLTIYGVKNKEEADRLLKKVETWT